MKIGRKLTITILKDLKWYTAEALHMCANVEIKSEKQFKKLKKNGYW